MIEWLTVTDGVMYCIVIGRSLDKTNLCVCLCGCDVCVWCEVECVCVCMLITPVRFLMLNWSCLFIRSSSTSCPCIALIRPN